MKKIPGLSVLIVTAMVVLFACKKDYSVEEYKETDNKTKPDLATKINSGISGFITDNNNTAVQGAVITAGLTTTLTDKYGYFKIENTSISKTAGFIKISKNGYFDGFKTFVGKAGGETFIRHQLISKTATDSVNAVTGGSVVTPDGAVVTIPANAVVGTNNLPYSGNITISSYWIDPSNAAKFQQIMPGDLRGIDTGGYLKRLVTYGMMAVELTGGPTGEKLQIASGVKAILSFPIPPSLTTSAPEEIALWYFDESNGLWKQEGTAVKTAGKYIGEVSHFTYWNCDYPLPLVNFTAQITDEQLHPLKNTPVSVSITDLVNSGGISYTDSLGFIYGTIPANNNMILDVLTSCGSSAYKKNFTTNYNDIDLGTVVASIQLVKVSMSGTVVDCNNIPVADGFIQTYGSNFFNRVPVVNGFYSFTGAVCANTNISLIAVNNATGKQSDPLAYTVQAGDNNIGEISVCDKDVISGDFITYSVNGGQSVTDTTLSGKTSVFNGSSLETWIQYIDSAISDTTGLSFTFTSATLQPGTYEATSSGILIKGELGAYKTNSGATTFTVQISEYGSIGGFITGSFTCTAYNYSNPVDITPYSIICSFRIKRTD